jgi:hypothetical protein
MQNSYAEIGCLRLIQEDCFGRLIFRFEQAQVPSARHLALLKRCFWSSSGFQPYQELAYPPASFSGQFRKSDSRQ